jgi:ubiquinone/menaquinone biosynthesis C-methylase UbiE
MKLDIGCGKNKKVGFTGLDIVKLPGVDIVCNLDKEKIPLEDNSVEEVFSMHSLEHVSDLLFVMEEIWRVCCDNAKVTIAVPYFTSVGAFRDPTHKHFFAFETFDHFTDTKKVPSFYSSARFKIMNKKILFYPSDSNTYGKIRFLHMMPFQWLANLFPYFYEHSFLKLFSARDLYIELKVINK